MDEQPDLRIPTLGPCRFDSPITHAHQGRALTPDFVEEGERILLDDRVSGIDPARALDALPQLELAGPRPKIFFDPAETRVGIVTCGGLCPGLNDVIRGIVMEAWYGYGVRRIDGFRYGFQGLVERFGHEPVELRPDLVSEIHEKGGSFLASSRGPQEPSEIVDCLQRRGVDVLFTVGGDGTMRGALDIAAEAERRGYALSVVGVPKTIDNDLRYLDRSFGFETAYSAAVEAIVCAHNEARGTLNGVGLVKVMGRNSGFLACYATLATSYVNFCLIPELPFGHEAEAAFLRTLHERLETRHHALVLVAEGAGQELVDAGTATDASGNKKLGDIGEYLEKRIVSYLGERGMEHSLKYIDPSYIVRSVPTTPSDSIYCWQLARNAVHAAMCGKTRLVVGRWHGRHVHVPIPEAVSSRNVVDTESDLWLSVLETTGQPPLFE